MAAKSPIMKTKISHCFPDNVMLHTLTLRDGSRVPLYVDPTETLGHALLRTDITQDDIASIGISGPLHYEPDYSVATR